MSRSSDAASPSGGDEREDRALGGEVLEDLAGDDREPASAGARNEQEEHVCRAHGGERLRVRPEALERERVAETEAERPLAIRRPELAEERDLDALPQLRALREHGRERAQERPRRALAEERARVDDAHPLAAGVREPVELLEVAAVRHDAARACPPARARAASSAIAGVTALTAATRLSAARAMRASTARLARTLRRS